MPSSKSPHEEEAATRDEAFLEDEGWWRVKIATPAVTSATTRYLYKG